jgi:hypothetical protein
VLASLAEQSDRFEAVDTKAEGEPAAKPARKATSTT